jgi:predicted XRE-type DNA-binding protein
MPAKRIDTADPFARPKLLKRTLKGSCAVVALRGRESAHLSQPELAKQLGLQQPHVSRCESREEESHSFTVLHVAQGPSEWALPLLRWQAVHHAQQVIAAAEVRYGDNHLARNAAVMGALSGLMMATAHALSDNTLTQSEARIVLDWTRKSMSKLLEQERYLSLLIESGEAAR